MPIYEYAPDGHECLMCDGRVPVIQSLGEPPLRFCPDCGLEVCRVISNVSIQVSKGDPVQKGDGRGFTAWKKAESGVWERIAGDQGPETIFKPAEDTL